MPGSRQRLRTRIRRWALVATVAGAGLATAAVATIAAARTFTLSVATRVAVTNVHGVTVHESVQQRIDGKSSQVGSDRTGIELGDVE